MISGDDILNTVRTLAQSQGSYGRLLEQLENDEEALEYLEQQGFEDPVDLILFLEQ